MYLTSADVRDLDEQGLRQFLERRIPEGHHLDYKTAFQHGETNKSGDKNRGKREFLKDITAFANANGGDLLIGVEEPRESLSVDDQIHGIDEGDKLAQDLERLASSSVDPRVPGLLIKPIPLQNGKHVLVVHVPPSMIRPYRIDFSGYVNFFIRHRESIFPMTTYEIREAVFTSASAEARAKEYLLQCERDVVEYTTKGAPAFFLQAMPLISPERPWDVLDKEFQSLIRDSQGKRARFRYAFASSVKPTSTIEGIIGRDDRKNPTWRTEIHRNGYISALDLMPLQELNLGGQNVLVISRYQCELFKAFTFFCQEVLEVSKSDSPYVLRCQRFGTTGVYLYTHNLFERFHGPWLKPKIELPDEIRQTGEDFGPIADRWCERLFHAFGLDAPV